MHNSHARQLKRLWFIPILVVIGWFSLAAAASAQYWVKDPNLCPDTYLGQQCPVGGEKICGVYSNDNIECYDPGLLDPPSVTYTTNNSNTVGTGIGGYYLDCYDIDNQGLPEPFCDNNGDWWCNRDSSCYNVGRQTDCLTDSTDFECGVCRTDGTGYTYCDGSYTDADGCEIHIDVDNCNELSGGSNVNNHVNSGCNCVCDTGYLDCDNDDSDANTGTGNCEIRDGVTACTVGGLPGTYNGCNCEVDKSYFETGTETSYSTSDPLLWGVQYGDGPLMKFTNYNASTTGGVFFVGNDGRVGIGTTSPSAMLTIGVDSGSQFLVNSTGVVTAGTWQGDVIGLEYGGTGLDLSTDSGFFYVSGGTAVATDTIHIAYTDLEAQSPLNLTNNVLSIDTNGNWSGTFDNYASSDFFLLSDWFGTSSAPQLITLSNLSEVGTITTGTWEADTIDVAHGGTGTTTWSQYGLVYAPTDNDLSQINMGQPGYLLMVNSGGTGYTWVASSSAGIDTYRTFDEIRDTAAGLSATSTNTFFTITYHDNNDDTSYLEYSLNTNLALYDNSISKFFSTTTDLLAPAYGGTGTSTPPGLGQLLIGNGLGGYDYISSSTFLHNGVAGLGSLSDISFTSPAYGDLLMFNGTDWINKATNTLGLVMTDYTGQAGYVAYWSDSQTLTAESQLAVARGGTGSSTLLANGLLYGAGTSPVRAIPLGTASQLLAVNGTGDGYNWVDASSVGLPRSDEEIRDISAALSATSSAGLIAITYNDNNNATSYLDFNIVSDLSQYDNSISKFFSTTTDILYPAYGGTGTSTLPGLSQLLIGNGLGGYDYISSSTFLRNGVANLSSLSDISFSGQAYGDLLVFNGTDWINKATNTLGLVMTDYTGQAGYVAYWNDANNLTSEQYLSTARGGLGTNVSAYTGILTMFNNTAIASSTLQVPFGGTGSTTLLANGLLYGAGTSPVRAIPLGTASQLLAVNGTGDGYNWVDASSVGLPRSDEEIRDISAALSATSSAGLIAITYNDNNNATSYLDFNIVSDLSQYDNSISKFFSTTTDLLAPAYGGTGLTGPAYGQLLMGNNQSGYSYISSSTFLRSGVAGLSSLADTNLGAPAYGDLLVFNGTDWINKATNTLGLVMTDYTGQSGYVAYWNDANNLTSEQYLSTARGGLGTNVSAYNGILTMFNNSAIASSTLQVPFGGTGSTTLLANGLLYGAGTSPVRAIPLGTASQLLAVNGTGDGYNWVDASSVGLPRSDEEIRDISAALSATSSAGLIAITYNDNNNATSYLDFNIVSDLSQYDNSISKFFSTTTDILYPAYGGTGSTTLLDNGLLIGAGTNPVEAVPMGAASQLLAVNGTGNGYTWVSTSSWDTVLSREQVEDYVGDMIGATSSITIVYDDNTGKISYSVADNWWNNLTDMPLAQGNIYVGSASGHPQATSTIYIGQNGNVGIGTTTLYTLLNIDGGITITGNIVPAMASNTQKIGSSDNRWAEGWFKDLYVLNMNIGSSSISGSNGNIFTINSDNSSPDLEDAIYEYERGSVSPNAQIVWDSSEDAITFNFDIGLQNSNVIRFYESEAKGLDYVGFRASSTLSGSQIWVLPTGDAGTPGMALLSDADGSLYWGNPSGAGSIASGTPGWLPYYNAYGNALAATTSSQIRDNILGLSAAYLYQPYLIDSTGQYGQLWMSDGSDRGGWAATSDLAILISDTVGTLQVARGGTGSSTLLANGLLVGAGTSPVRAIPLGTASQLLAVNGTGDGYNWVDASSVGLPRTDEEIRDISAALSATSSAGLIAITYNDNNNATSYLDFNIVSDLSQYDNSISKFFSTTTDILALNYGGLGVNTSGWNGIVTIFNNTAIATDTITLAFGGTGKQLAASPGAVVYSDSDSFELTGIGNAGNILMSNGAGAPVWASTSTFLTDADFSGNGILTRFGNGQYYASTTLQVPFGGTGSSTLLANGLLYGAGTSPVRAIPLGTASQLLAVNGAGDGYHWVDASSVGLPRTDEEIRDISAALSATSSAGLIAITYNDNNNATSYLDFNIVSDLSQYDNSISKFFSTTTDLLAPAYGGTGSTTLLDNGLLIGAGTNPVEAVPMGQAGYLLMVNAGGTGYTWVASSSAGVDTKRSDDEILDLAGNLSATTTDQFFTITYHDLGGVTSYLDYNLNTNLALYDNSISKFFSTTTDLLAPAYGGTGLTGPAYGQLLMGNNQSGYSYISSSTFLRSGVAGLSSLADTNLGAPAYGDLLVFNGTDWINKATNTLGLVMTDYTGQSGYVAYWNDANNLTSEQYLSTARGGLGTNVSAYTGVLTMFNNTAIASSTLQVPFGGTGSTTLLANGLIYGNGTGPVAAVPMGTASQLLAVNGAGDGYHWVDASSVGQPRTDEEIRDISAALSATSSAGLIAITYNDNNNATSYLDFNIVSDLSQYDNSISKFFSTTTDLLAPAYGGTGLTGPAYGQLLMGNNQSGYSYISSSTFLRSGVAGLSSLADTNLGAPAYGDLLVFNGTDWINKATNTLGLVMTDYTGQSGYVAYWNDANNLTSEQYLSTARGGLGTNVSAYTGVLTMFNNTAIASSTLQVPFGGTGSTTLLANGLIYGNGTGPVAAVPMGTASQLLAVNGAGDGYHWVDASSVGQPRTDEEIRDISAALSATSSAGLIAITYNDNNNATSYLDFNIVSDLSQYDNSISKFFSTTTDLLAPAYGGTGLTGPAYGQLLMGNNQSGYSYISSSTFLRSGVAGLSSLADTNLGAPAYGDLLVFNGTDWINKATNTLGLVMTDYTGQSGYVAYWNDANNLTSEQYLSTARGGLGTNVSAYTGVLTMFNNTAIASSTLQVPFGGTGSTTLLANGLIYGNGTGPVAAVPMGTASQLLAVNGAGDGYHWVDASSVGQPRTDEEIRDISAALSATSSAGLIAITYNDNNNATSYLDFNVNPNLALYDNSISKFFSTTTDILAPAYGGTGSTTLLDNGLLIGAGANPVEAVPMGQAGYLLMVNAGGTGYTWVASSSTGVDTKRSDDEILDLAGNLSATSTDSFFTITYHDLGGATSYLDYNLNTNLALYDNSISKFYSTTTGPLAINWGGTGSTTLLDNGLLIGAGTNPVEAVPMGQAGYLLMVNAGGTGYTWVASTSAGVNTYRTDEEIRDISAALSATSSAGLIAITYNDNNNATSYLDFNIVSDLSQYDNSISKFFSTTTDLLAPAYGGTGLTGPAYGQLLMGNNQSGYSYISSSTFLRSGVAGLSSLADTNLGAPAYGDLLVFNGTDWINKATNTLGLVMTDYTGQSGYVAYWNDANNLTSEQYLSTARGGLGTNVSAYTGVLTMFNNTAIASSTLQVPFGGTGSTTLLANGLIYGNGTGPVAAVPMGTASQLLAVNGAGDGYHWVDASSVGQPRTDEEIRDISAALSATSSAGLIAITYNDNNNATSYLDFNIVSDLSQYDNSISKFFSTTTDLLAPAYGGTGLTGPAYGQLLIGNNQSGYSYISSSTFLRSGVAGLSSLADTNLGAPAYGDLLVFNGTDWINKATNTLGLVMTDYTGQSGYVAYWNDANNLTSEQYLSTARGGLGTNVSAYTGVLTMFNNSAIASSTLQVPFGGTGSTTLLANGLIYGNGTGPVAAVPMGTASQLLAVNGAGDGYHWVDASSVGQPRTDEEIRDISAALSATSSAGLIAITYNDNNNATSYLDFNVNPNLALYDNSISKFFSTTTDILAPAYGGTGLTGPAYGQLLMGNTQSGYSYISSSTFLRSGVAGLSSLADTNLGAPAYGDLLVFNGTDWINKATNTLGLVMTDYTGQSGYVAYWNDANNLTSEQYLSTTRGGLGTNVSAYTGVLTMFNNTAIASSTLQVPFGGTGSTTLLANGLIYGNGTGPVAAVPMGTASQLLAVNGAGDGYHWVDASSVGQPRTDEEIRDISAALSATSSAGLIAITYNDNNNATSYLDFNVNPNLALYDNSISKFFSTTTDILYPAYGGLGTSTLPGLSQLLIGNGLGGYNYISSSTFLRSGVANLGSLSDISFSGQAYGDLLMFNGTDWINKATNTLGLVMTDYTGQSGYVAYWNDANNLTSEQYLSTARGGLGTNVSAYTGVLTMFNNTAIASSTLQVPFGGTGSTTLLANGLIYGNGTGPVAAVPMGTASQLLAVNGAGDGYHWVDASSVGQPRTDEEIRDISAALSATSSAGLIAITYNDNNNATSYLDFNVNPNLALYDNSISKFFSTTTDILAPAYGGTGLTGPAYGQLLMGNTQSGYSYISSSTFLRSGVAGLSSLADTNLGAPAYGDLLVFNGTDWINKATNTLGLVMTDYTGQSGYVAYWNDANNLTSEQYLSTARGGLGTNVSAYTGVLTMFNNSAIASSTLQVPFGGTGSTTLLANGLIYGNGTGPVAAVPMGTASQLLAVNGAGDGYHWVDASSVGQPRTDEEIRDISAALSATSSAGLIAITYNDNNNATSYLDFNIVSDLSQYDNSISKFFSTTTDILAPAYGGTGLTGPAYGQLLMGNTQSGYSYISSSTFLRSGVAGLSSLYDVSFSSLAYGDFLMFNGTSWTDMATSTLKLVDGSGQANYVTYWQDGNTLAGEQFLSTTRGGLGSDISAFNGVLTIFNNTAVATSAINMAYGGTGKQLSPVAGGLVYTDANSMEVLGASTAGYILMSGGANAPQWISTSTFVMDSDFSSDGILTRFGSGNYISSTTLQIPFGGTGLQTAPAYGQLLLGNNTGGYTLTGTSSLGLIDGSGAAGLLAVWSDGNTLTSSNTLQMLYGGTGNTDFSAGSLVFSDGHILTQDNAHLYWDNTNNFLGLGTSSPAYLLDVYSSSTDYLARIYNTSTAASSSGLYIRTDGAGQLLTLNAGGSDVFTVSEAASVFNNPVTFGSAGDVSIAQNLVMTNPVAGNIKFSGPGYLETVSAFQNLDLTLRAANNGMVVVNDGLWVTGSTSIDNASDLRFYESDVNGSNYVGFQASSTLAGNYLWVLPTTAGTNGDALLVQSDGTLAWGTPTGAGTNELSYAGYATYYEADGTTVSGTSSLFIYPNGNIGIGTSTPQSELSVTGDLQLAGTNNYLNFSDSVGSSSYGFRDYNGTMQYKNTGGEWVNIGSAGSAGDLGSMSGVSISNPLWGDLLMYNGTDWINNATSSLGLPMGSGVAGQLAVWSDHDTLEASNTLQMAYGGTGKQLSPVAGGLVYTDANSMEVLGAWTAGYILMSGGANAPQWISTSTFVMDSDFSSDGILTRFGAGSYIASSSLQPEFGGTGLQTAPGLRPIAPRQQYRRLHPDRHLFPGPDRRQRRGRIAGGLVGWQHPDLFQYPANALWRHRQHRLQRRFARLLRRPYPDPGQRPSLLG